MLAKIEEIRKNFQAAVDELKNAADVEKLRIEFLGKKGQVSELMKDLRELSVEEKKAAGQNINNLKKEIETIVAEKITQLALAEEEAEIKNTPKIPPGIPHF